ncbi:GerAB/ArcD/ProY family transporter [Bacillus gobiensis]|uniref:GerAB/ArcD/ProY family transporter n=1 Tax=Bacillus gobiensis TaxID=1441095 RepID=UPI003D208882
MEKAKISAIQLFSMMLFFELGSALVVSLASGAKKDAWFAIFLGMCSGFVLFFIYYFLYRKYPNLPFTGYARKIAGKYLGWVISLIYVIYFLYAAARNLRDFGDLLRASTLTKTPVLAITVLFLLVLCYVLFLGIETLGRTAEVFIVILIFFGVTASLLVFFSGYVDFHNLQPFLENGWEPILKTVPSIAFFPFGEFFVFTMLLPYLNQPESAKKVWLSALFTSGIILMFMTSLNIAVLGLGEMEVATFPLLSTIGRVNLFDFIQRLDAVVVLSFLLTMFYKISIFFYSAIIGMVDLFKLKKHQILLPSGLILIILTMVISSDFPEHIEEGQKVVPYSLFLFIHILIPLSLLLVATVRNRFKKAN